MKRILSLILVVVMLVLALVGCGYSVEEDKMTKYGSFDKAAFEALLQTIKIEDGDFTTDSTVRFEKVLDSIYAAIAEAVGTDAEAITEGAPDGRDVVYYSYYATANLKDDVTGEMVDVILYTSTMKSESATKIQLGVKYDDEDGKYAQGVLNILKDGEKYYDFSKGYYQTVTSGNAVTGDKAYVTYTVTGKDNVPVTYTNHPIIIGDAPAKESDIKTFEEYLDGKGIGQYGNIKQFEIKDTDGSVKETYSNIKINWVSSRVTYGVTALGDKVYVSYKEAVDGGEATAVNSGKPVEVTITDEAGSFANFLLGKDVGKLLKVTDSDANLTFETTNDAGKKVVYSNIKIEWVAGEEIPLGSFTDITFDEKTLVKDTQGIERNLKDVAITYYIFPVNYKETPEYTAELLVDKVIGKDIKADTIIEMIFANEFAALDDDAKEADIDAVKALAADFKVSAEYEVEGLRNLTIANLAEKIAKYYTDITTAETALTNAEKALDDAKTKYSDAQAKLDAAKAEGDAEKIAEAQKAFDEADVKLNGKADEAADKKTGAIADQKKAEEARDKIENDKKDALKALLALNRTKDGKTDVVADMLYYGYEVLVYNALQDAYNEEIKLNLAREIYYFLTEKVTLNGKLPEDLVEDAYDQIFEKYESDFYTGTDTATKITNYKLYKASFDKFLIAKVTEDIKEVKTVKDAKAAIKAKAEESCEPIVKIFLVAQTYGKTITEKDYEKFKDKLEEYYYYYILYYKNFDIEEMVGENNIKTAAQFNKLLDWFLEFEEVEAEARDDNGFLMIEYKFNNDDIFKNNEDGKPYEFGTPASDAAKDAEE